MPDGVVTAGRERGSRGGVVTVSPYRFAYGLTVPGRGNGDGYLVRRYEEPSPEGGPSVERKDHRAGVRANRFWTDVMMVRVRFGR